MYMYHYCIPGEGFWVFMMMLLVIPSGVSKCVFEYVHAHSVCNLFCNAVQLANTYALMPF